VATDRCDRRFSHHLGDVGESAELVREDISIGLIQDRNQLMALEEGGQPDGVIPGNISNSFAENRHRAMDVAEVRDRHLGFLQGPGRLRTGIHHPFRLEARQPKVPLDPVLVKQINDSTDDSLRLLGDEILTVKREIDVYGLFAENSPRQRYTSNYSNSKSDGGAIAVHVLLPNSGN